MARLGASPGHLLPAMVARTGKWSVGSEGASVSTISLGFSQCIWGLAMKNKTPNKAAIIQRMNFLFHKRVDERHKSPYFPYGRLSIFLKHKGAFS